DHRLGRREQRLHLHRERIGAAVAKQSVALRHQRREAIEQAGHYISPSDNSTLPTYPAPSARMPAIALARSSTVAISGRMLSGTEMSKASSTAATNSITTSESKFRSSLNLVDGLRAAPILLKGPRMAMSLA